MTNRRLGLSRKENPHQLLRKIANTGATKNSGAKNPPKLRARKPVAINDPPLSSDDEDGTDNVSGDDQHEASNTKRGSRLRSLSRRSACDDRILSSSGDDGAAEADIKPTSFGQRPKSGKRRREETLKTETDESIKRSDSSPSSSKKRKQQTGSAAERHQEACEAPSTAGNPHKTQYGLAKSKPSRFTYGKQKGAQSRNQLKKRKTAAAKSQMTTTTEASTAPQLQFKLPPDKHPFDLLCSPQQTQSRITKLKSPDSPPRPPAGLIVSSKINDGFLDDSPTKTCILRKASIKVPAEVCDLVADKGDVKTLDATVCDVTSGSEQRDSPSPVSKVSGSDAGSVAVAAECPWCGQPVEKSVLDDFSRGKRMNVRLQTKFCRDHKIQTAKETWQAMRYPEVDWEGLVKRFAEHRSYLLGIVDGNTSHYRRDLAAKIKSGEARSMKKEGDMNPGYYGPRGFNVMCDYLVEEFGELLKRKAVNDRVIAGRGPAAFIQCVLVAELAVMLIRDDMDVSQEEARRIMEESKALGEMLHDEA